MMIISKKIKKKIKLNNKFKKKNGTNSNSRNIAYNICLNYKFYNSLNISCKFEEMNSNKIIYSKHKKLLLQLQIR